jgi:hypothetical protein
LVIGVRDLEAPPPGDLADGAPSDDAASDGSGGDSAAVDAADAGDSDAACGAFAYPAISSFADDFSGNLATNWNPLGGCISEQQGELVASPFADAGDGGSYCFVTSIGHYHLTCSGFTFRLIEATPDILGQQTVVYIYAPGGPVSLYKESGSVTLAQPDGGTVKLGTYDPVQWQWWRMREDGGQLFVDTSPDGVTFTNRGHAPVPFALDSVRLALGAGVYKPFASPGRARFDCLNVPAPCP